MTGAKARLLADAVLACLTVIWGTTFVVVKDALGYADPFSFLVLRFALATAALLVLARRRALKPAVLRPGVLLGLLLALGYGLQTWGLRSTTPSRSAFITGLCVVMVPFIARVCFKQRFSWPSMVGAALAALGLYWLTGAQGLAFERGEWLTFGCAVAYAFHIVLVGRFAVGRSPVALTSVQLAVVTLCCLVSWPLGERRVEWSWPLIGAVVVCGLVATSFAISVQAWAQARTTSVRAALLFSLEPVVAAAFSALLGREQLSLEEWAGGGLIVVGVAFSEVAGAMLAHTGEPVGEAPG